MQNITCVSCNGSRVVTGIFPVYSPDFQGERKTIVEIPCDRCGGTGLIPEIQLQWIETGNAMKRERLSRQVTLRKEAERRGMLASDLSKMERGVVQPEPSTEA